MTTIEDNLYELKKSIAKFEQSLKHPGNHSQQVHDPTGRGGGRRGGGATGNAHIREEKENLPRYDSDTDEDIYEGNSDYESPPKYDVKKVHQAVISKVDSILEESGLESNNVVVDTYTGKINVHKLTSEQYQSLQKGKQLTNFIGLQMGLPAGDIRGTKWNYPTDGTIMYTFEPNPDKYHEG